MRSMWDIFLEMNNLEEDIDRLVLIKNRERQVDVKNRLDKEIDSKLTRMLEIKHKLQDIQATI